MSKRLGMLESSLQRAISEIIQRELGDPALGMVTITQVRLSPDLHQARVFTSVLGDEKKAEESLQILNRVAGRIRHGLRNKVKMRHIPALNFIYDDTPLKAERLERIISEIHTDDEPDGES